MDQPYDAYNKNRQAVRCPACHCIFWRDTAEEHAFISKDTGRVQDFVNCPDCDMPIEVA